MSEEERTKLINIGYSDSMKYLTGKGIQKKMRITNFYNKMLDFVHKLIRALKYNNIQESEDILKDLFLFMSDAYRYIDSDIFESLWTLKNDILSAPKKRSFFKGEKFEDKTCFVDTAEIIYKVITIKRDELVDYVKSLNN